MEFEYLYPAAARNMLPHIDEVINTYGTEMSDGNLARMSDDLARRSMMSGDPPRSNPNTSALNDIARILLIQRLIEQGYPVAPFFFFPPVVPFRPFVRPFRPITPARPR